MDAVKGIIDENKKLRAELSTALALIAKYERREESRRTAEIDKENEKKKHLAALCEHFSHW